jgi:MYXO-CTERM domain-containing protein
VPYPCRPLLLAAFAVGYLPATAGAHFYLQAPPATYDQNALGDPQKAPPCGDAGTAVATGIVTSFEPGQTITVTIDETIFHPGHYRIALALDDGVFPEEPPVTPDTTPCGSAPIDPNPTFPILADGVFEHTEAFSEPQSIDITLPDDVSCDNCTLQIIQFMSNHALNDPGGCYYHHCAQIAISSDPVAATSTSGDDGADSSGDGATSGEATTAASASASASASATAGDSGGDAAATDDPATGTGVDAGSGGASDGDDGGCSCSSRGGTSPTAVLALLGLVGLRRSRRRARG